MVCVAAITSLTGCVGGSSPECGSVADDKLALFSNCKPQEYFNDLSNELGVVIYGQNVEVTETSWIGAAALGSKCVVAIRRSGSLDKYNILIEERFGQDRFAILNDVTTAEMAAAISENRSQCS
jgi:hypothetical protein